MANTHTVGVKCNYEIKNEQTWLQYFDKPTFSVDGLKLEPFHN